MSDSLIGLAQMGFPGLTQAETRMLIATANGQVAICGDTPIDSDPSNDLANSPNWAQERTIRSG
ncbi:MAG: hypothetical protein ABSD43_13700, partial [Terracidiphilus sp.]